ncbi:MAG: ATPase [Parcubacteria group bacterium LiPW_15]|nr:MAG: ATPase [Parcubacteria group bacterium LiPW_15]
MIRITNIKIENFRSCISTTIALRKDLTTLIGINGAGKSNILTGIQLLRSAVATSRNRFIHKGIRESLSQTNIRLDIDIDNKKYILKANIYYDTDEENIDEIDSVEIFIKKAGSTRTWAPINGRSLDLIQRYKYLHRVPENYIHYYSDFNAEDKLNIRILEYLASISYYGATQFSDPTQSPVSIELEDSKPSLRTYRTGMPHNKFIFDLFISWKKKKKEFNRFINIVNKNGIGLISDIKFAEFNLPNSTYGVKPGGKIRKEVKSKNIIIPSVILDGLSLSPNQLSEGTFKTLALIFYILNDQSELLLIEEPEVCVHHGLLNSIIELIKIQSKQKQIVVSTHSDYVLDKINPENVIIVRRNKKDGTTAKALTKTLSKNDFAVLKEYLNTSGNLGEYWKEGGFENEPD